jgi:hypothetical protein
MLKNKTYYIILKINNIKNGFVITGYIKKRSHLGRFKPKPNKERADL